MVSKALAHLSMNMYEKCVGEIPARVKFPSVHKVQTKTRNVHKKFNDG